MDKDNLNELQLDKMVYYLLINSSFISDISLFHGKMGIVLFFAHYGRYTGNPLYDDFASELLEEIYEDIHINLIVDFENGLCGIGWGIEYLVRNEFMEGDTDAILEEIDLKIMERDPRRIRDLSFRTGLGGILYYVVSRLTSSHAFGAMPFDAQYITELRQAVQNANFVEKDQIPMGLTEYFLRSADGVLSELYPLTLPDVLFSQVPENKDYFEILPLGINNGLTGLCFSEFLKLSNRKRISKINGWFPFVESKRNKIPSLSFCITCKNRFHQIQKTLRQNLEDNRLFSSRIEFVLVDFGSTDGLRAWIKENFMEDIKSGYLRYFYTDKLDLWHASLAKNTAHFYAKNDIVVNLDCDNFTGKNGGKFVIRQFLKYEKVIVLHQFSGDGRDGTFGRIAVGKEFFHKVGGYDESLEPMGYQDKDLIFRLCKIGLQYILNENKQYSTAIKNKKSDSIVHTHSKLSWEEMDYKNWKQSVANIKAGRFIVNNGSFGLRKGVEEIYKL